MMCVNTLTYIYIIFTSNIHPHMSDTCKGGTQMYIREILLIV